MDIQIIITLVIVVLGILIAIYLANKRTYRETTLNRFDQFKEEANKVTLPEPEPEPEEENSDGIGFDFTGDLPRPGGIGLIQGMGQMVGLFMGLFVFNEVFSAVETTINATPDSEMFMQTFSMAKWIVPVLGILGVFMIISNMMSSLTNSEAKPTQYRERKLNRTDKYRTAMNTKTLNQPKKRSKTKKRRLTPK